jgi:hypothetical protein
MKTMNNSKSNGKSDSKSTPASNYPLKNIEFPHVHDVLCGRGGLSNNHVGNTHWRMLIAANKSIYVSLRKSHKILLSRSIVYAIRGQNPPGRFLQKDGKSGLWYDVGDHKAQEKTSQALREGAPDVVRSLMSPETVGAANDLFLTPQSYNPPSTQANANFVSTRSDPDAMYPPVNAGPYMLNAHPMRGPCVAYPPMYMPPGMPYFPPHMPPAPYPDARQSYPTCSSPQVVPSRAPETLQIPTLNTEASPTENKTAADITPSSLEEPPKTEKGGATDNDNDDKTESEKPEIVSSDSHEPPSFGSLETLRLESMGISSFATKLEAAGTSFARMSFSLLPDPVDGGLETFGSLSLNETPPRRSSSPLTKLAQEIPANSKTRQRQRSPGGLLDDSEDEDESEATNPSNKTADWEKMRAVFDLKQHDKSTAAAAAALDKNAPVPTASLDGDISSGVMSTFSTLSSRGTFGENSTPVVPAASPPRELSEREKLEMEYLNRGVSLACQDFDMNRT